MRFLTAILSFSLLVMVFEGAFAVLAPVAALAKTPVQLQAKLSQSLGVANQENRIFLQVHLEGLPLADSTPRAPVNVALVIDRSGSMAGQKLEQAKKAAIMAVNLLNRKDIVSVIAYSDRAEVVVPATRLTDKADVIDRIRRLNSRGMTALYAGVSRGAEELRKFFKREQVNRIVLLSDGLANIGPRTPEALGELGQKLGQEGISVTTIGLGLGYNEDLMAKLAYNSDGNHAFVEHATDLVRIFREEFGDVLSIVAQGLDVTITCHGGVRPVRVLGRRAEIDGNRISFRLNQLYGGQEKYVVVELEVPPYQAGERLTIADVAVTYLSMADKEQDTARQSVELAFTHSRTEAENSIDKKVMAAVVNQIAIERNEMAVKLRDKGRTRQAVQTLKENAAYLRQQAKRLQAPALEKLAQENEKDAAAMTRRSEWNRTRKSMKYKQFKGKMQQKY